MDNNSYNEKLVITHYNDHYNASGNCPHGNYNDSLDLTSIGFKGDHQLDKITYDHLHNYENIP
jgi:hypothetical protein